MRTYHKDPLSSRKQHRTPHIHGTGNVYQKNQVAGRYLFRVQFTCRDLQREQLVCFVPGAFRYIRIKSEYTIGRRRNVFEIEIIQQFFGAHRIGRHGGVHIQKTAHIAVRGLVGIDGKTRFRIFFCLLILLAPG